MKKKYEKKSLPARIPLNSGSLNLSHNDTTIQDVPSTKISTKYAIFGPVRQ
jgi:hypothetical protein